MKRLDFEGKLVVVTGASSGLGREMALRLACVEGADLVVAARRTERLEELAAAIRAQCSSRVHVLPIDLASPDGAYALFRQATALGEVYALVTCAGMTFYGKTLDASLETYERMISVNFSSQVRTTLLFLPYFLQRGRGGVLAVTSESVLASWPNQTVYAATKHAVQAFMEGLAREYRGRGIVFSTFAPGGMATEMMTSSGLGDRIGPGRLFWMQADTAARLGVAAFKRGRLFTVPGIGNKLAAVGMRLLPRTMVAAIVDLAYKPRKGKDAAAV